MVWTNLSGSFQWPSSSQLWVRKGWLTWRAFRCWKKCRHGCCLSKGKPCGGFEPCPQGGWVLARPMCPNGQATPLGWAKKCVAPSVSAWALAWRRYSPAAMLLTQQPQKGSTNFFWTCPSPTGSDMTIMPFTLMRLPWQLLQGWDCLYQDYSQ